MGKCGLYKDIRLSLLLYLTQPLAKEVECLPSASPRTPVNGNSIASLVILLNDSYHLRDFYHFPDF